MSDRAYPAKSDFERGGGAGAVDEPGHEHADTVFESLSHRHRRVILSRLREQCPVSESAVLEELSRPDDKARIQMRHQHLPKLMRAGYVHWDQQSNELSRGPYFEEVARVLELVSKHADELPGTWP